MVPHWGGRIFNTNNFMCGAHQHCRAAPIDSSITSFILFSNTVCFAIKSPFSAALLHQKEICAMKPSPVLHLLIFGAFFSCHTQSYGVHIQKLSLGNSSWYYPAGHAIYLKKELRRPATQIA